MHAGLLPATMEARIGAIESVGYQPRLSEARECRENMGHKCGEAFGLRGIPALSSDANATFQARRLQSVPWSLPLM